MPATFGYALYRIFYPVKRASKAKRQNNAVYQKLMHRYFMRSLGWAIVCSALSYAAFSVFGVGLVGWYLAFIWILLLLYEIDERMFLLPDLLTVPLLIGGFMYTAFNFADADALAFSPVQLSALGAAAGYFLPVLASLFLIKKHPDAFGGGDIKLLSACGAWIGLEAVPYLILASTVVFGVMMLAKRQRVGAFGPAIVIAVLALVFLLN
jgi:prepilin signal peptidase PulO-like enzyme (type II secretory pathway)